MIEQHVDHRRHQECRGDAFALDGRQEGVGIESLVQDDSTALKQPGVMMTPAAWVIGVAARNLISRGQSHSARVNKALVTRLWWLSMTPLAPPVVPPV